MSSLLVRQYREEDKEKVLNLYEHSPLASPFITRQEPQLLHYLRCPGVDPEGVFVALSQEGDTKGLAIVAIIEEAELVHGMILELWGKSTSDLNPLLTRALEYCRDKGADLVSVSPPPLKGWGKLWKDWIASETVVMFKPLNLLPLVQALSRKTFARIFGAKGKVVFVLDRDIIEVKAARGDIVITQLKEMPSVKAGVVHLDRRTFLEIVFGEMSPLGAFLKGKIRIQGWRQIPRVLKLLMAIRAGSPHFALADDM